MKNQKITSGKLNTEIDFNILEYLEKMNKGITDYDNSHRYTYGYLFQAVQFISHICDI